MPLIEGLRQLLHLKEREWMNPSSKQTEDSGYRLGENAPDVTKSPDRRDAKLKMSDSKEYAQSEAVIGKYDQYESAAKDMSSIGAVSRRGR